MTNNVIFSGIQPTGNIHIGNYLGAIRNWKKIVDTNPSDKYLFSIVDLHSITIPQKPEELRGNILQTFATYIACGLLENKNVHIFQQSSVAQHTELAWFLSCNTPLGWLDRMTQYKDKTSENKSRACLGLYAYPVLMAADILLYDTTLVPVGEDQVQHIELARDIAIRINGMYECNLFTVPEYVLNETKRVMSLRDGSKKMSKSDESDFSRINISDTDDIIAGKLKKATTGDLGSPEVQNLITIYRALSSNKEPDLSSYAKFKQELSDIIIAELSPIRNKISEIMKNKDEIIHCINSGAEYAGELARRKMEYVYDVVGFKPKT